MKAKPKWLLQLLQIYMQWSNKNALIFLSISPTSLSQMITSVFSTCLLNHNSPVSSLPHLLPNVLKTGYLHLNTNHEVWHPPPPNNIPVSQSIKIVDPTLDPLLHTFLKKLWLPQPPKPSPLYFRQNAPPPYFSLSIPNKFLFFTAGPLTDLNW